VADAKRGPDHLAQANRHIAQAICGRLG